ncbi:MAG: hypothetical protein PVF68_01275 [Acidobacteriota bacterium]|jgi:hypothetical protein
MELDERSLERLKSLAPAEILEELRRLAFASGGGSDVYGELLEAAVAGGLLAREDVERLDEEGRL